MNRLMILAAATTMLGVGKLTTEHWANPPVDLQPTTPGTQQSGNINVSGTVLAGTFYASSSGTTTKVVSGWATSATGFVFGGDFRTNSVDGRGIFASALATTGSNYGGDFRSASSTGRGIFGYASSPTGQGIGGDFRTDSTSGTGVIGRATDTSGQTTGGSFIVDSPKGVGINVLSTATTGQTYGGIIETNSDSSLGSVLRLRSNAPTGDTTVLDASVTQSMGPNCKGIGVSGNAGYGIFAKAQGPGGWGIQTNGDLLGIYAQGKTSYGISAISQNPDSNGVRGHVPAGGTGAAIFANGVLAASGTKTMRIDHPDDPEKKYLIQYCAEGDTPQLNYTGIAKLDHNGAATIALPSYFDKINRNPTYQLTPLGASMPNLYVSDLEHDNQFTIAGGKAGASVSWTIVGIRNDRFVQKYGAKTEVDKPSEFQGTYLSPELYNKPHEMREGYSPKEDRNQDEQPQIALSRGTKNGARRR